MVEHPDATQKEIALAAGYKALCSVGNLINHNASVREKMAEAMGLDPALCDEALRVKMKEGLNATVVERSFDRNGNHVETFDDVDYSTRRSYLQLAGKWRGLEMERHEVSGPNGQPLSVTPNEILKTLTREELDQIIKATE